MKTILELGKIKWVTEETAKDFAALARTYLDKYEGEPMTTTAFYFALGASLSDFRALGNHAWSARQSGALNGYYSRDNKKSFGHHNIKWHTNPEAKALRIEAAKPLGPLTQEDCDYRAKIEAQIIKDHLLKLTMPELFPDEAQEWADAGYEPVEEEENSFK